KRAEQVFGGRDEHALSHQAGRVTHAGDVLPAGRNSKPVQIRTDENQAGGRRRGRDAKFDWDSVMEANARYFYRAMQRGLETHSEPPSMANRVPIGKYFIFIRMDQDGCG